MAGCSKGIWGVGRQWLKSKRNPAGGRLRYRKRAPGCGGQSSELLSLKFTSKIFRSLLQYCYFYCCQLSIRRCTYLGTGTSYSRSLTHLAFHHHGTYAFQTFSPRGKASGPALRDSQATSDPPLPSSYTRILFLLFLRRCSIRNAVKLHVTSCVLVLILLFPLGSSCGFPPFPVRWMGGRGTLGDTCRNTLSSHSLLL